MMSSPRVPTYAIPKSTGTNRLSTVLPDNAKNEETDDEDDDQRVVETDPTGRFERYAKCLGRGAYKEVFKAFDNEEGVEVAWNQLKLDHLSKREAQRTLSEIEILQSLRNEHIINIYHSWSARGPDSKERIYFITELMTSGTLKSYIRKTKGPIKPKVLKNWCRQILLGLEYLHSRNPPIIHRDLKCENIFINGNNGQAKIGDLGLATVRNGDHVSSVLGTPEFMAPEFYDEYYTETVDVYAFGLCVLEMCTKEYPYSECTNQAQIYKKVTTGIKPLALQKVQDPETKRFIELCIQFDHKLRPKASELLRHPFLALAKSMVDVREVGITENSGGVQPPPSYASAVSNYNPPSILTGSLSSSYADSIHTTPLSAVSSSNQQSVQVYSDYAVRKLGDNFENAQIFGEHSRNSTYIDTDNHTYQIQQFGTSASMNAPGEIKTTCTVEVVENLPASIGLEHPGMMTGDREVMLRMIYGVAGRSKEIKFPFNLFEDNSADVVAEMVREKLISPEDQNLALRCVEDAVRSVAKKKSLSQIGQVVSQINHVEGLLSSSSESYFHGKDEFTVQSLSIQQQSLNKAVTLPRTAVSNPISESGHRTLTQNQRAPASSASSGNSSASSRQGTPNNVSQPNVNMVMNTALSYTTNIAPSDAEINVDPQHHLGQLIQQGQTQYTGNAPLMSRQSSYGSGTDPSRQSTFPNSQLNPQDSSGNRQNIQYQVQPMRTTPTMPSDPNVQQHPEMQKLVSQQQIEQDELKQKLIQEQFRKAEIQREQERAKENK